MPDHLYYTEKKYIHKFAFGTVNIPIYQPTTSGVMILCEHYREKYTIDLQCIDLIGKISNPENTVNFFSYLSANPDLITLHPGQTRGLILTHGTSHAIPVLIHQHDDMRHLVVFDSSSGSRVQGYFKIANQFNETDTLFYLNSGTRQSDGHYCITDAICILKEALLIDDLIARIENKIINEHASLESYQGSPGYKPLQLIRITKPPHFRLFHMPEQLLLTAQRPAYVQETNADLSVMLRGGRSLGDYREHYKATFTFSNDEQDEPNAINGFLFLKGAEYKAFLDYVYEQKMDDDKITIEKTASETIALPFKTISGLLPTLTIAPTHVEDEKEEGHFFINRSGFFPPIQVSIAEEKQKSVVRDTVLASPPPTNK